MIEADFWRGRRVLLTGHTGFKGSWLSLWLQGWGAELTGYALAPPSTPSLFEAADVARGMRSIHGDVRDPEALAAAFAEARPEVVIHMAAQSLVRLSYETPVETYATNVMGTVGVLEAARRSPGLRALIVVTSDKCYENREWVWGYRERDPMGGVDPYSSSKGCAELVTASWRRSFFPVDRLDEHGVAVASVRAGNVIGGGDWAADRLVPDAARAWTSSGEVALRSPHAVRPWQHVLEPLGGYLRLARRLASDAPERARFASGWNFGPRLEDTRTVGEVIGALARHWGPEARWRADDAPRPHEANLLRLDCTRAHVELGWRPLLELDEALGWIARWYRDHARGASARELAEADIGRYVARLDARADMD